MRSPGSWTPCESRVVGKRCRRARRRHIGPNTRGRGVVLKRQHIRTGPNAVPYRSVDASNPAALVTANTESSERQLRRFKTLWLGPVPSTGHAPSTLVLCARPPPESSGYSPIKSTYLCTPRACLPVGPHHPPPPPLPPPTPPWRHGGVSPVRTDRNRGAASLPRLGTALKIFCRFPVCHPPLCDSGR